jgi:Uma2 family endonuclease
MSTAVQSTSAQALLTADEFARRHGGDDVELIDGVVQELPVAHQRHGYVNFRAAFLLGEFVVANDLGRITTNDSFVKTRSSPDRVRGADICYFSYERLPRGEMPDGLLPVSPDLVVEVRSPSQGWDEMLAKVSEYLAVDVRVVIVLDMDVRSAAVYRKDEFQQVFDNGDNLTIPDVLPGFNVPVRKFFE